MQLLFSVKIDSPTLSGYIDVCLAAKDSFIGEKIGFENLPASRSNLVTSLPKKTGCYLFEVNGSAAQPIGGTCAAQGARLNLDAQRHLVSK